MLSFPGQSVAQANVSGMSSVIIWSAVLIGLVILLFFIYSQFKKWMKETNEPVSVGFSLSDLRELHRQGKMSTEEFEAAKTKIVASAKRMTANMPAVLGNRAKRVEEASQDEAGPQA